MFPPIGNGEVGYRRNAARRSLVNLGDNGEDWPLDVLTRMKIA